MIRRLLHAARPDQQIGIWRALCRDVAAANETIRVAKRLAEMRPDRVDALFSALIRAEEQVDPLGYVNAVDDLLAAFPGANPAAHRPPVAGPDRHGDPRPLAPPLSAANAVSLLEKVLVLLSAEPSDSTLATYYVAEARILFASCATRARAPPRDPPPRPP